MNKIRFAQYGTKHFHAAGKLTALLNNPHVELAGVYEPDTQRRAELQKADGPYQLATFFEQKNELLGDSSIAAVASEGMYQNQLLYTEEIVSAGKHVWHDKPAGTDLKQWRRVLDLAEKTDLHVQVGYMLRYHNGVRRIEELIDSGALGNIFAIRAYMSTNIAKENRNILKEFPGGIFFDLGPHILDLIVWFLGRPHKITSFLRNDSDMVSGFCDNTLAVLEYDKAMATVSIAAMETNASQMRRLEVQGDNGNVVLQPLEKSSTLLLQLKEPWREYDKGAHELAFEKQSRQTLYDLELAAFLETIQGKKTADRDRTHDFVVQETLLRSVNRS